MVLGMEMKFGTHTCNIVSMTTTLFKQQQIHSSNFLKNYFFTSQTRWRYIAQMEIKLGTHAHYIISMTNKFRHFSSNLLTVTHMEMKLGMHACYHDNFMFPWRPHIVLTTSVTLHSSYLLTVAHMDMKLGTHAYYIISMTTRGLFW